VIIANFAKYTKSSFPDCACLREERQPPGLQ
jgi:hypothetical protein